jgi:hypothetical protein
MSRLSHLLSIELNKYDIYLKSIDYEISKSKSYPSTRHKGAWGGEEFQLLLTLGLGTRWR